MKVMKKVLFILAFLCFPLFVQAKEFDVNLYFFRGEGCPHCAEEEKFLETIKNKYDNLTIIDYEVWYNDENAELLGKVLDAFDIKKSGVPTKDIYPFNPGTFVTALNNVYGFDGANLQYGPISKVVPGFVYQDRVMLKGKTKAEKLALIRKYQESGYYLAAEVAGATETSQHWVAIDNVVGDKIYMLDPGSEATDMWKQYDWNLTTQFVYFKATK